MTFYLISYDFKGATAIPRMFYYYRQKMFNEKKFKQVQQSVIMCHNYQDSKNFAELVEKYGGEALVFKSELIRSHLVKKYEGETYNL